MSLGVDGLPWLKPHFTKENSACSIKNELGGPEQLRNTGQEATAEMQAKSADDSLDEEGSE